jgi:hypothetical protein
MPVTGRGTGAAHDTRRRHPATIWGACTIPGAQFSVPSSRFPVPGSRPVCNRLCLHPARPGCEHELSGSRPPPRPTLKRRAESTKGAAAPALVCADALRQPSAALPDAHALQAFSPVEPAQAGFAAHCRGLMVFEEIIRSSPHRRASPWIAEGLSPTARGAYRIKCSISMIPTATANTGLYSQSP